MATTGKLLILDDQILIECVEQVRQYCLSQLPDLHGRLAELATAPFARRRNDHYQRCAVAALCGCDLQYPDARRAVEQIVAGGADGVSEAVGLFSSGKRGSRSRKSVSALQSVLHFFERPEIAGDPERVARELQGALSPSEALGLVAGWFPGTTSRQRCEFLFESGYPIDIPNAPTRLFLHRLGVLETAQVPDADALHAVDSLSRMAGSTSSCVGLTFQLFSGARRHAGLRPICGRSPRCGLCPLAGKCSYKRYHPNEGPSYTPIREWVERDRPRERLLANSTLTDAELLAIILRTGSGRKSAVDMAREILAEFGDSLARLDAASPAELQRVVGVGPAKSAEIIAALALGRRVMKEHEGAAEVQPMITNSTDVGGLFRSRFSGKKQEEFYLLTLNSKNRVTREIQISVGTLNASMVHPRDVFRHALAEAAASVVFVHNHPSGDPRPSAEDRSLTKRLGECGKLMGIRVLDHVIVGAKSCYSFADEGELG